MKTIQEIQEQINTLSNEAAELDRETAKGNRRYAKIGKVVTYLREVILFLEVHPTKEMVQPERLKMQERLQTINTQDHFEKWCKANLRDPEKDINAKKDHDKVFNLKDIQRHYRNAGFILNV